MSHILSSADTDRIAKSYWVCWMGMHWGFRRHAVVYWACTGRMSPEETWRVLGIDHPHPLDVVVFYREFKATLVPEAELAQMIVEATPIPERRNIKRFYAGNNVFAHEEGSRRTIAGLIDPVLSAGNLPKLRLSNDGESNRVPTFRMVRASTRRTISMRDEDTGDASDTASDTPLLFISAECPKLIDTIPSLISTDPKNPEDVNRVGTVQDDVWQACMNTFREYPSAIKSEPLAIRRQRAIDAGDTPMQKRFNMLRFDLKNKQGRRTKRI